MRLTTWLCMLTLTGCGVADVGTTAATNAKLQADDAKQAQQLESRVNREVAKAAAINEQRTQAAEQ